MLSIHAILHPTDFSDCSRYAFRLASMLAREQGARLVSLDVQPTLGPTFGYGKAVPESQSEGSQEKLSEIHYHLRVSDPKVQVEHLLVNGGGAQEILREAEIGADRIVIATHGRIGLGWLLVGGVAEVDLRKAQCPVVTVKIPRPSAMRIHRRPPSRPRHRPLLHQCKAGVCRASRRTSCLLS